MHSGSFFYLLPASSSSLDKEPKANRGLGLGRRGDTPKEKLIRRLGRARPMAVGFQGDEQERDQITGYGGEGGE